MALTQVTGNGIAYSGMPTGSVLQVVQAVKGDDTNFESTSFTDISGVTVNITPKFSSSKVLVQVTITGEQADDTHVTHFRLMRGSTAIGVGDTAGDRTRASFSIDSYGAGSLAYVTAHFHYLDSPSTTSETTYKLQGLSSDGIFYVGRNQADTNGFSVARLPTVITVTEIAG